MQLNSEIHRKILEQRIGGAEPNDIAALHGMSVEQVGHILRLELDLEEDAPEGRVRRSLEWKRLERLQIHVWDQLRRDPLPAIDRALRIIEARTALGAVSGLPGPIRIAYDKSVGDCTWLTDADGAAVATGGALADRIDAALAFGQGAEVTKALYLVPHLMNVLAALGATPKSREEIRQLAGDREELYGSGKLAEFQSEDRRLRAV